MDNLIPRHGGYRRLKSFQLARLIYDITVRFCERFVPRSSRTYDQMIQAARSGVQNIAEGSKASGTSKKTELKLTNVSRSSLEELFLDYEDFLRQNNYSIWNSSDPRRTHLIAKRCETADQFVYWVKSLQGNLPEIAANGLLVLIKVACYLLDKQIATQAETFQKEGGFTERLYKFRKQEKTGYKT